MSPKCKALCASKLGIPAEFAHFLLTCLAMGCIIHLNILLRLASLTIFVEKGRISAIKDIYIRIE